MGKTGGQVEVVSYDQACETPCDQLCHQFEQLHLMANVQRGGWFIQYERPGLLGQGPCHPNSFPFATR